MVLTIAIPDDYPYVLLSTTIVPFVANFMLGGKVRAARARRRTSPQEYKPTPQDDACR